MMVANEERIKCKIGKKSQKRALVTSIIMFVIYSYKNKFKFPFIIAVKDKDKSEILNIFRKRIHNSIEDEYLEARNQVKKIAITRLNKIFEIN